VAHHQAHSAHGHTALGTERAARVFVVTVSDTRTSETDTSGPLGCALLEAAGHVVRGTAIVPDEIEAIGSVVRASVADPETDVVLLTGGTGIALRDVTPEAIAPILDRPIDGFGELFRSLSFAEIGPAAMLSRAVAGIAQCTLIVALPGSSSAVRLGLEKLLLPELGHLIVLLRGL